MDIFKAITWICYLSVYNKIKWQILKTDDKAFLQINTLLKKYRSYKVTDCLLLGYNEDEVEWCINNSMYKARSIKVHKGCYPLF